VAGASVSGLVSGLDTATIISQLMQVEAAPQTLLKTKLSTEQGTVSNLQSINAKFAALATRAAALATSTAWTPLSTTSSSDAVTVSAGATAIPGSVSFTVDATASATKGSSTALAQAADVVTDADHQVVLTVNGKATPLDAGDGTLGAVVSAVNAANAGVTAVAVRTDAGYRLKITANATGADQTFSLATSGGAPVLGLATTAGTDARLTIDGDVLTSRTNTFAGLTQGVDVTVKAGTTAGTRVDVSVARNPTAAQASVQSLVDAANEILSSIDSMTAYNATTKASGPLAGDGSVRDLRAKVLDTVTRAADGTSMSGLGVGVDRFGKVTFDSSKFATAYAADPGAVAKKLGAETTATTPGWAARLQAVGKLASDSTTGLLTQSIQGHQRSVTTTQSSIEAWDVRLTARKAALTTQFSALEVTLGKLQDQASWLSGQVASLPKNS
jgi:flagellar hook-associated protein 2